DVSHVVPQPFSRTPGRPETRVSGRSKLYVLDVGNLLAQVVGEALLHPDLDLADALARDAELVADLLEGDRLLVPHERLEAPFVDHQILALERFAELARGPADETMILLVGDGVRRLRPAGEEI